MILLFTTANSVSLCGVALLMVPSANSRTALSRASSTRSNSGFQSAVFRVLDVIRAWTTATVESTAAIAVSAQDVVKCVAVSFASWCLGRELHAEMFAEVKRGVRFRW